MTDTAELRRLLAGATPGPWTNIGEVLGAGRHRIGDTQDVCCFGHSGEECSDEEMSRWAVADAAFIAAARNALPALLDELERLRRYAGLIDVVRSAEQAGVRVHVATQATCTEHRAAGDDQPAWSATADPRAEGGQG